MNRKIKFTHEWDKLNKNRFHKDVFFTTFRGYEVRKHVWYREQIAKDFDVELNGNKLGEARLLGMTIRWSTSLSIEEIQNDTHEYWTRQEWNDFLKKMYGSSTIMGLWLIFKITSKI